jgi:hypothetical protein
MGFICRVSALVRLDSAEQPASIQEITVSIKEQDEEEGSVTFNLGVDSQFIRQGQAWIHVPFPSEIYQQQRREWCTASEFRRL